MRRRGPGHTGQGEGEWDEGGGDPGHTGQGEGERDEGGGRPGPYWTRRGESALWRASVRACEARARRRLASARRLPRRAPRRRPSGTTCAPIRPCRGIRLPNTYTQLLLLLPTWPLMAAPLFAREHIEARCIRGMAGGGHGLGGGWGWGERPLRLMSGRVPGR